MKFGQVGIARTIRSCSIGIDRFWLVGVFRVLMGKNCFRLVWLIMQLFQAASNQVETVEKALALLCRVIVACVRAIPRSYRVSTANGWKTVLLRNVNRINPNQLQLKRLIPIEHDLKLASFCSVLQSTIIVQNKDYQNFLIFPLMQNFFTLTGCI